MCLFPSNAVPVIGQRRPAADQAAEKSDGEKQLAAGIPFLMFASCRRGRLHGQKSNANLWLAAADAPSETEPSAPEVPEKPADRPADKASLPPRPESVEKMPRYKFSVIYYPDSKIWMVKSDFSDKSTKLQTCDGREIEDFLIAQLPAKEQEALRPAAPQEAPGKKEAPPAKPQKPAITEVDVILRNRQGEPIRGFAQTDNIGKAEIALITGAEDDQPLSFDVSVTAKSLEDHQIVTIGAVSKQRLRDGRLEVPIYGAGNLKKGPCRFTLNIKPSEQEGQAPGYYGSQMVVLT